MSVIVKGMEMPESCAKCKLKYWTSANPYCPVIKSNLDWNQYSTGEWTDIDTRCPLGELPEKHGRLGDLDEIINKLAKDKREAFTKHDVWLMLSCYGAETIVEAEGD